jgi:hypothetical protein
LGHDRAIVEIRMGIGVQRIIFGVRVVGVPALVDRHLQI